MVFMKKRYNIVVLLLVIIVFIFFCSIFSNKNEIASVKSDEQLSSEPIRIEDAAMTNSEGTKDYSRTNIQVQGVDEADIVKTDGDYIYSLSENNVIITNVKDPANIKVESKINEKIPEDLILYKDKLVIISADSSRNYGQSNTIVSIYDISDKANPKKVKSFELYEPYFTTRCIDNKLYVFSSGYLRVKDDKVVRKKLRVLNYMSPILQLDVLIINYMYFLVAI